MPGRFRPYGSAIDDMTASMGQITGSSNKKKKGWGIPGWIKTVGKVGAITGGSIAAPLVLGRLGLAAYNKWGPQDPGHWMNRWANKAANYTGGYFGQYMPEGVQNAYAKARDYIDRGIYDPKAVGSDILGLARNIAGNSAGVYGASTGYLSGLFNWAKNAIGTGIDKFLFHSRAGAEAATTDPQKLARYGQEPVSDTANNFRGTPINLATQAAHAVSSNPAPVNRFQDNSWEYPNPQRPLRMEIDPDVKKREPGATFNTATRYAPELRISMQVPALKTPQPVPMSAANPRITTMPMTSGKSMSPQGQADYDAWKNWNLTGEGADNLYDMVGGQRQKIDPAASQLQQRPSLYDPSSPVRMGPLNSGANPGFGGAAKLNVANLPDSVSSPFGRGAEMLNNQPLFMGQPTQLDPNLLKTPVKAYGGQVPRYDSGGFKPVNPIPTPVFPTQNKSSKVGPIVAGTAAVGATAASAAMFWHWYKNRFPGLPQSAVHEMPGIENMFYSDYQDWRLKKGSEEKAAKLKYNRENQDRLLKLEQYKLMTDEHERIKSTLNTAHGHDKLPLPPAQKNQMIMSSEQKLKDFQQLIPPEVGKLLPNAPMGFEDYTMSPEGQENMLNYFKDKTKYGQYRETPNYTEAMGSADYAPFLRNVNKFHGLPDDLPIPQQPQQMPQAAYGGSVPRYALGGYNLGLGGSLLGRRLQKDEGAMALSLLGHRGAQGFLGQGGMGSWFHPLARYIQNNIAPAVYPFSRNLGSATQNFMGNMNSSMQNGWANSLYNSASRAMRDWGNPGGALSQWASNMVPTQSAANSQMTTPGNQWSNMSPSAMTPRYGNESGMAYGGEAPRYSDGGAVVGEPQVGRFQDGGHGDRLVPAAEGGLGGFFRDIVGEENRRKVGEWWGSVPKSWGELYDKAMGTNGEPTSAIGRPTATPSIGATRATPETHGRGDVVSVGGGRGPSGTVTAVGGEIPSQSRDRGFGPKAVTPQGLVEPIVSPGQPGGPPADGYTPAQAVDAFGKAMHSPFIRRLAPFGNVIGNVGNRLLDKALGTEAPAGPRPSAAGRLLGRAAAPLLSAIPGVGPVLGATAPLIGAALDDSDATQYIKQGANQLWDWGKEVFGPSKAAKFGAQKINPEGGWGGFETNDYPTSAGINSPMVNMPANSKALNPAGTELLTDQDVARFGGRVGEARVINSQWNDRSNNLAQPTQRGWKPFGNDVTAPKPGGAFNPEGDQSYGLSANENLINIPGMPNQPRPFGSHVSDTRMAASMNAANNATINQTNAVVTGINPLNTTIDVGPTPGTGAGHSISNATNVNMIKDSHMQPGNPQSFAVGAPLGQSTNLPHGMTPQASTVNQQSGFPVSNLMAYGGEIPRYAMGGGGPITNMFHSIPTPALMGGALGAFMGKRGANSAAMNAVLGQNIDNPMTEDDMGRMLPQANLDPTYKTLQERAIERVNQFAPSIKVNYPANTSPNDMKPLGPTDNTFRRMLAAGRVPEAHLRAFLAKTYPDYYGKMKTGILGGSLMGGMGSALFGGWRG